MNAIRRLLLAGVAMAPTAAVARWSGTVVGLATPTTTTTAPQHIALPTTTRPPTAPTTTRSTTATPSTTPPVIVQPPTTPPPMTTTRPPTTRPATTSPQSSTAPANVSPAPGTPTSATPATLIPPDLFVGGVTVGQGAHDAVMPLVAGRSSTWVRVVTGHAGGGDAATVDGALLVERPGESGDVLLAENGPASIGPEGGVFEFRLDPEHTAAGSLSLTFFLFNPDGGPVDDSPGNNSSTTAVEFHTARHLTLLLFVDPDLDQGRLAAAVGGVAEEVLDVVPATAVDVQLVPLPITDTSDSAVRRDRLGLLMWSAAHIGDPDGPVIVGRVYNAASRGGDDLLVADVLSFDVYDFPGDFRQRFDGVDYCHMLDELGVPCDRLELGVVANEQVPGCETEAVEWAGLQLDLCVDDDSDAPVAGQELEEFNLTDQQVDLEGANLGGWMVVTGDWDGDAQTASVDWATTSDALPPSLAERVGESLEGAVNGTAPASIAVRLVDAAGAPIVAMPAVRLSPVFVSSWPTSGDADERPTDEPPRPQTRSEYLAAVPLVDGAVAVELVSLPDGTVLDSLRVGGAAPRVGAVQTETVGASQSLTVGWDVEGTDEPAAGQTFDVWLSNDGFATSVPVAVGVTGNEVILKDASYYSHTTGDGVQVRVVPGGVVHTDDWDDHATSEPFSVAAGPPLVALAGVPDSSVDQFDPIELTLVVAGPPGRIDDAEVVWTIDGTEAAPLFDGRLLTARDLQPGEHVVTVIVTDPATGTESSAEAAFQVVASASGR